jgi:hypothetical protein
MARPPLGASAEKTEHIDNQSFKKICRPERQKLAWPMLSNTSMMHKVSLLPAMMVLLVAAVAARVRAMIDAQVPVGYQDQDGFHAGVKTPSDSNWPSMW